METSGPYRRHTAFAAIAAIAMVPVLATAIGAQSMRASESIGVSLTILPPARTDSLRVVGFEVDRDGLVTLQLSAPHTSALSSIAVSRLDRDTTINWAASRAASATPRHEVRLGLPRSELSRDTVRLWLRYLTVPGT